MKQVYSMILVIIFSRTIFAGQKRKPIPPVDSVLVFAPHPDDDIIGCGGTLIHHVQAGARVAHVYMTSGDALSRKRRSKSLARIREKEAKRGAQIIGVSELIFLREPDSALRSTKPLV